MPSSKRTCSKLRHREVRFTIGYLWLRPSEEKIDRIPLCFFALGRVCAARCDLVALKLYLAKPLDSSRLNYARHGIRL